MPFPRTYAAIERKILKKVVETKMARAIVRKGMPIPQEAAAASAPEWFCAYLRNNYSVSVTTPNISATSYPPFGESVEQEGLAYDAPGKRFVVSKDGLYRFETKIWMGLNYAVRWILAHAVIQVEGEGIISGLHIADHVQYFDQNSMDTGISPGIALHGRTAPLYLYAGTVVRVYVQVSVSDEFAGTLSMIAAKERNYFTGELVREGGGAPQVISS